MSDAFRLVLPNEIGLTEAEIMQQCKDYWKANQAIDKLLNGEYSPDDVADHLKMIGIDPMAYRDEVIENIELAAGSI